MDHETFPGKAKTEEDIAVLMLTSGSTGNPKAVCLRHGQILASLKGKAKHHGTTEDDVFLNWTGLDHVANLTEIHLHAMSLAAKQVHLDAADILADPVFFLEAIHAHKVTYTFAPNFFLTTLVRSLESLDIKNPPKVELNGNALRPPLTERSINLSSLRAFISGGESNVTEICDKLSQLLWNFGAPRSFIRPGFGMTETCAGSIYNAIDCPSYDIEQGEEFCSLGECIEGIEARIVRSDGSEAETNEIGSLQVSGPAVFAGYYYDEAATREAFTADGWFKTGDLGLLDSCGRLRLTGRDKDITVING
jgi:acyl-CoA synthetase (AMP-forming)/AMP-acid ligase II